MAISTQFKKSLKARAHKLKPIVLVGRNGISDNVINEVNLALAHHQLIKIKVNAEDRLLRHELIQSICDSTEADLIQCIGTIAVLYKKSLE